jgi:Ca2+-binding EF-hand superfamily protein
MKKVTPPPPHHHRQSSQSSASGAAVKKASSSSHNNSSNNHNHHNNQSSDPTSSVRVTHLGAGRRGAAAAAEQHTEDAVSEIKRPATYLSEAELERARVAFDKVDLDKSGSIDLVELREALRELGQEPTVEELVKIIADIDEDMNGLIDFEDFIQLVGDQKVGLTRRPRDNQDTLDAFVALGGNDDKTGHILPSKLEQYVTHFGLPVSSEALFKDMCQDSTGLVDYEQFRNLMSTVPEPRMAHFFQIDGKNYSWEKEPPNAGETFSAKNKKFDLYGNRQSWQNLHHAH